MTRSGFSATMAALAAVAVLFTSCSSDDAVGTSTTSEAPTEEDDTAQDAGDGESSNGDATASELYADPANWLCRPDLEDDACDIDLDATLVMADGTQSVEPFEAAVDAPVDCFYVYPTISTDDGANSDLVPGDAEKGIAGNQAARFGEVCNVYAPVYRQVPLGALFDNLESDDETTTTLAPDDPANPRNIAYADVHDSFLRYMADDNAGRPFVLIGHSQGSGQLARLVAEEVDGDEELRDQMLSVMLIGGSVTVDGEDNSFENIDPCASPTDTSCVISYASFYAGEPPPADSLFGYPRQGGGRALCSNPGNLSNAGPAPLNSYFQEGHVEDAPEVSTPWIHYEGLVTGECVSDDDFDWLELANTAGPTSALPGDLGGRLSPKWGTHLADINFAIGDLVELARTQSGQG